MTLAQLKLFFRSVIKVVAGGPAVGTPGQNRAAGVLQALDALADFVAGLGGGTVKSVNGVTPGSTGDVVLPQRDPYGASQAKRQQVASFFTSTTQYAAADVALAGDSSTGLGSIIYDGSNGVRYELAPDYDTPNGQGNATPTWYRQAL